MSGDNEAGGARDESHEILPPEGIWRLAQSLCERDDLDIRRRICGSLLWMMRSGDDAMVARTTYGAPSHEVFRQIQILVRAVTDMCSVTMTHRVTGEPVPGVAMLFSVPVLVPGIGHTDDIPLPPIMANTVQPSLLSCGMMDGPDPLRVCILPRMLHPSRLPARPSARRDLTVAMIDADDGRGLRDDPGALGVATGDRTSDVWRGKAVELRHILGVTAIRSGDTMPLLNRPNRMDDGEVETFLDEFDTLEEELGDGFARMLDLDPVVIGEPAQFSWAVAGGAAMHAAWHLNEACSLAAVECAGQYRQECLADIHAYRSVTDGNAVTVIYWAGDGAPILEKTVHLDLPEATIEKVADQLCRFMTLDFVDEIRLIDGPPPRGLRMHSAPSFGAPAH